MSMVLWAGASAVAHTDPRHSRLGGTRPPGFPSPSLALDNPLFPSFIIITLCHLPSVPCPSFWQGPELTLGTAAMLSLRRRANEVEAHYTCGDMVGTRVGFVSADCDGLDIMMKHRKSCQPTQPTPNAAHRRERRGHGQGGTFGAFPAVRLRFTASASAMSAARGRRGTPSYLLRRGCSTVVLIGSPVRR